MPAHPRPRPGQILGIDSDGTTRLTDRGRAALYALAPAVELASAPTAPASMRPARPLP